MVENKVKNEGKTGEKTFLNEIILIKKYSRGESYDVKISRHGIYIRDNNKLPRFTHVAIFQYRTGEIGFILLNDKDKDKFDSYKVRKRGNLYELRCRFLMSKFSKPSLFKLVRDRREPKLNVYMLKPIGTD